MNKKLKIVIIVCCLLLSAVVLSGSFTTYLIQSKPKILSPLGDVPVIPSIHILGGHIGGG